MQEYYDLLGVTDKDDVNSVKEAFKNKKAKYQADLLSRDQTVQKKATEEISKLTTAYRAISGVAPKTSAKENLEDENNEATDSKQQEAAPKNNGVEMAQAQAEKLEKTAASDVAPKPIVKNSNIQQVETGSNDNKSKYVIGAGILCLVIGVFIGTRSGVFTNNNAKPPKTIQNNVQTNANDNLATKIKTDLAKGVQEALKEANAKDVGKIGMVTGNDVIMRSVGSTIGTEVAVLNKGEKGEILERQECADRNAAMLMKAYRITLQNGNTVSVGKGYALVIDRSKPEKDGKLACTFDLDGRACQVQFSKEDIKELYGDIWYKIRLNNGTIGWVYGKYFQE